MAQPSVKIGSNNNNSERQNNENACHKNLSRVKNYVTRFILVAVK